MTENIFSYSRNCFATAVACAPCSLQGPLVRLRLLVFFFFLIGQHMSASVCVYVVFAQSFPPSSRQKSRPITLQLESLRTDERGTRKEEAAKTDVLIN